MTTAPAGAARTTCCGHGMPFDAAARDRARRDAEVKVAPATLLEGLVDGSVGSRFATRQDRSATRRGRVVRTDGDVRGPWVVVPTYNEAQNVGRLLQSLLKSLRAATRTFAVLVVDDGSPDGTGELVDAPAAVHPEVRVL